MHNIVACKFPFKLLNAIDINFTFMHPLTGWSEWKRATDTSLSTPPSPLLLLLRQQDDRKQEEYKNWSLARYNILFEFDSLRKTYTQTADRGPHSAMMVKSQSRSSGMNYDASLHVVNRRCLLSAQPNTYCCSWWRLNLFFPFFSFRILFDDQSRWRDILRQSAEVNLT